MQFSVSEEIFEKFPAARIGVVVASGIDNTGSDDEIQRLLENIQTQTKIRFDTETLAEHPSIAVWRDAYASFGSKPRDFRSSIEALVRSVLNGRGVRHINKLVDIYNYTSLKHAIPVGGEDLDKTSGNLYLKFSDGHERFIPLGSDKEDNPYAGEEYMMQGDRLDFLSGADHRCVPGAEIQCRRVAPRCLADPVFECRRVAAAL